MMPALKVASLARQLQNSAAEDRACRSRCERELVHRFKTDPTVRDHVVDAFLPFAMSFAIKLKRGEEPLDDLRQVAAMGLMKALIRFDPDVGESFVAYAAPTILGELRRHYRDTGWAVHVPRAKQELAQRIAKAEREVRRAGRAPRAQDVAECLGITTEEVMEGRIAGNALRAGSLDRPISAGEPGGATLADARGAGDPGYERVEQRLTIGALSSGLSERDRVLLTLRFGEGLTQRQIGKRIGVSQMQVSRLLRRVVDDLHEATAA